MAFDLDSGCEPRLLLDRIITATEYLLTAGFLSFRLVVGLSVMRTEGQRADSSWRMRSWGASIVSRCRMSGISFSSVRWVRRW
jgi:hypothetical protein